jgi:aminoglycoside phosphotransferase (APT) family kinase protein
MNPEPPGRLLATGRAADVYDIGGGRVLRRYRPEHRDGVDARREARVLAHVSAHGYPVPETFAATATDLEMERLDGPTMLDDLARRPWRVGRHAALLAALHERLHAIPPLEGLPTPFGDGDAIIHLDLHPDNVMLTAKGPVVIDWQNAGSGEPGADVAKTWLILATAQVSGGAARRLVSAAGRKLFLGMFLRRADVESARPHLRRVADTWEKNPRTSTEERRSAHRLATGEGRG